MDDSGHRIALDNIRELWTALALIRLWRDRAGTYRRDTGDGEHVEIVIAERVYRVRAELLPGLKMKPQSPEMTEAQPSGETRVY